MNALCSVKTRMLSRLQAAAPPLSLPACLPAQGYNLTVGGGLGRTHRDDETFPRLADPLCFVEADDIFHAVKAVVAVQRDYGRRDNRKQARLKYLVAEWGIDRFRWGGVGWARWAG